MDLTKPICSKCGASLEKTKQYNNQLLATLNYGSRTMNIQCIKCGQLYSITMVRMVKTVSIKPVENGEPSYPIG